MNDRHIVVDPVPGFWERIQANIEAMSKEDLEAALSSERLVVMGRRSGKPMLTMEKFRLMVMRLAKLHAEETDDGND